MDGECRPVEHREAILALYTDLQDSLSILSAGCSLSVASMFGGGLTLMLSVEQRGRHCLA